VQVGDLVQTTISGMGKPRRTVMGILIKPVASIYWKVLLENGASSLFEEDELKVISANR